MPRLSHLFLFLGLFHYNKAKAIQADFLGSERRFNDSITFDSYFCCNLCDNFLIWLVNGVDVVAHRASETTVNTITNVPSNTDNIESIQFSSTIVSLRQNNSGACMDVILIATHTDPNWSPEVICRGSHDQHIINVRKSKGTWMGNSSVESRSRSSHNVTGKFVGYRANIVSTGTNYITGAVVCRSKSGSLSWHVNNILFYSLDGLVRPGRHFKVQTDGDPDVVFLQTVVLQSNDMEISSLLIGTGQGSQNISVRCISDSNEVYFRLDESIYDSSFNIEFPIGSNVSLTVAGTVPLTSCLASIVMSLMIALVLVLK